MENNTISSPLDIALEEYSRMGIYPFHMPGHKRQRSLFGPGGGSHPFRYDITEIEGADDLSEPSGILKDLQDSFAALYGAADARLSVNGSTGGIYSAVFSLSRRGDTVLIERASHRSIYNAAALRGLKIKYIKNRNAAGGFRAACTLEDIEIALKDNNDISLVVITTPTYEGQCADVAAISKLVHSRGAKLLVDCAHGSHLGFSDFFPANPIALGADAAVLSLHKTLPALGQTSLILSASADIDIQTTAAVFNTSSPSYLLMASAANVERMLREESVRLFSSYVLRLRRFYDRASELKNIAVVPISDERDPGKIVILLRGRMTGSRLLAILRRSYKLELEMAGPDFALAMTSIADTDAGLSRLSDALELIDGDETLNDNISLSNSYFTFNIPTKILELSEAVELPKLSISLERSQGEVCGSFICPYPPGIPVLLPGEKISKEALDEITAMRESGIRIKGIGSGNSIYIING